MIYEILRIYITIYCKIEIECDPRATTHKLYV